MGAGATRDGVHDDPVGQRFTGPGEQGGGVLEFVQPVDADDPELPHRGVHDGVGAGQLPGVGGGHPGAGLGAADLDGDDGDAVAGGPVGGQQEGPAVLEALDVAGDGADLGLLGEVGDEVGGLEVGLVARGSPVGEPDAQLLEGVDGPALVAGLGDQGDGRAVEVVAELLEGVEVGVGAEEAQARPPDRGGEPGLGGGAGVSGLGEAGGEGDGELHLGLGQFLDHRQRIADEEDGEVHLLGQVGHGRVAGQPEDRGAGGVHGVDPGADALRPGDELAGDAGVRSALGVGGADDGHGLGPEEPVQVGDIGVQGPSADVHRDRVRGGRRRRGVDGRPGGLAAGLDTCAEVGGEGAVSRSKHRSARSCSMNLNN